MDISKVQELFERAVKANLDGTDFIAGFSDSELAAGYNGIGPEFLPAPLRAKTTRYLAIFEPAALIHDMRNHVGDATRRAFDFANLEFRENCLKLADLAYPWYSWRRYRARAVALLLFEFVQGAPGWIAWIEASSKNLNKESN